MTILLKQIFALIKLLHSEQGTKSIAWGVAMGFILGMTPALSLQSLLVFLLLFLFRIQIGAAFLAAFFFKFIAFFLDPLFNGIGASVLEIDALHGLYTTMYNIPILPWTRFYNTIVMGSGVVSILLVPVIYFLSIKLIEKYRATVVEKIRGTKWWKVFQATGFYKWYVTYDNLYGGV
jgi:uncharacterized protein (TIGR03546 family)